ncbi:MAG: ATP-binding cassette domain-containing protein [Syntrophobacterales bacterium]|jgi:ABC-type branched-subunit amino acid transport system ATPase component|nr:ATP-binding cassette domain-containing protein [Syntrophobacterales bacterium]
MLLAVDRIDVFYGRARVLSEVSLHARQGEVVFIVGRNGAGKTTMLKTIAGFLSPGRGSIQFAGEEIAGRPADKVARLGIRYVFQDKRVFTKLTVRENIELAAYAAGVKLSEAVDRVVQIYPKITRFLESKAGGLSGGQRQLLLIGRAVVGSPRLLLIDEPTEGLAAGTIEEVLKALELMRGEVTMVIVEQNLSVVSRLADRIYCMKEGHIPAELSEPADMQNQAYLETYL